MISRKVGSFTLYLKIKIFISDKHCEIASAKETFTIVDVAPGWLYEPMYKVEENDLIWSESMLVQIEEYSIKEEMLCGKE